MIKYIKNFIVFFMAITTAILFLIAAKEIFNGYEELPKYLIFQILGVGALTALITTLAFTKETKSTKHYILISVVHYVTMCIIMIGLGTLFGWINLSFWGALLMAVYVAVVYIIVFALTYIIAKKEADELNRAISERQCSKNK